MYKVENTRYLPSAGRRNTELKISNVEFRFLNEEDYNYPITRMPYMVLCTSYLVQ